MVCYFVAPCKSKEMHLNIKVVKYLESHAQVDKSIELGQSYAKAQGKKSLFLN